MEDKIKGHTKKIKVFLFSAIVSVLILFGTHSYIFDIVAMAISMYFVLSSSEDDSLVMMMYLMPMAPIYKLSASSASVMTYIELLFVLKYIIVRKGKLSKKYVWILYFLLYIVFFQLIHGGIEVTTTIKIVVYILLLVIACQSNVIDNHRRVFFAFIFGVLISSLMRYADSDFFRISAYMKMKAEHIGHGIYSTRFSGLYGDPNYYSINVIIALVLIIILLMKSELSVLGSVILTAPLVYFCALTQSKSALFMLAVVLCFLIAAYYEKRKYFLSLAICVLGFWLVSNVFEGKISLFSGTIDRIVRTQNSYHGITSSRSAIWSDYLEYLGHNLGDLVFGRSLLYYTLDGHVTHNTYIDILYELGIIGGLLLFKCISIAFAQNRNNNRTIVNYSLVICVFVMYFFLSELQYFDPPFHLLLCYYVLNLPLTKFRQIKREKNEV